MSKARDLANLGSNTSALATDAEVTSAVSTKANTADVVANSIVDAKGDLLTATADNTPARLAAGSNGQMLYADSTAATGLKWDAAPASGSMTQIATGTLSGSSVTISSIPSTYKALYLKIENARVSSGTPQLFLFLDSAETGTYYEMYWYGAYGNTPTFMTTSTNVIESYGLPTTANDARRVLITAYLPNYTATNTYKSVEFSTWSMTSASTVMHNGLMQWDGYSAAVSAIKLKLGSSSFGGGTYTLFGVN